jgi:flavodoxin
MKSERYSIIYSSKTGNTKKLAETIYNTLSKNECDYYGDVNRINEELSGVMYIGFWTEKGNADSSTIEFLKKLKNKKIFLFGTAGYGESEKYFEIIINNVKKNIDSSNTIIGTFMCQGKMPLSIRERYEKMREQNNVSLNIDDLIANFDKALSHPNENDLKALEKIVLFRKNTI